LNISRRPIIHQDYPKNVILCLINVNGASQFTALPDDKGKFGFKIKLPARA
jgi:hypothetical protein